MELISTISALLNIFTQCFSIVKKLNEEEREKMCILLKEIGDLLKDVVLDLSNNIYPSNKCAQMEIYLNGLEKFLDGKVTPEEKDQLLSWMTDAVKIEQLLSKLGILSSDERSSQLNNLDTIAGRFSATSRLLELQ